MSSQTDHTNTTAESLRTLHRIHQQLRDLKERRERGPRRVRARQANLARLEEEREQAYAAEKRLHMDIDEKNLELSSKETAVEKRKAQLQQASDNKEYQALKDQIAAAEMANSVLADEILEAMEKQDELAGKVAEADAAVAKAKEEVRQTEEEVQAALPEIEGEIARLEGELKECEEGLPGEFKEQYARVVRAKGEDALAPLSGEFCGGCNQHVPVNDIANMMLGEPKICRSCGRLLYVPEGYSA